VAREGSSAVVPLGRRGSPLDDASFDSWALDVGPDLLRFARITTGNDDPDDLVQEALVAVFTRWSRLGTDGAAAYARRVIVNGRVSRWRRWRRHVVSGEPTADVGVPAGQARVEEVLTARQLLGTLPTRQRAAVFLRFYDQLSYRDIAEILGCREATARSHVHRALHQLKTHLDEGEPR